MLECAPFINMINARNVCISANNFCLWNENWNDKHIGQNRLFMALFFRWFFFILSLVLRLGQTIGIFVVVVVFYKIIITMDIVIAISTI